MRGKPRSCYVCGLWHVAAGFLAFAAAEPLARYFLGEVNSVSIGAFLIAVLFFLVYFIAQNKKNFP